MADPTNAPPPAPPAAPRPPEAPPQAGPERAEAEAAIHGQAREALGALQTDVQKDYDDFLAFIEEEGIDFAANRANQIIVENLQSFLQENQGDAPEKFQQEWRRALIEFLKSEMRSADEPMSDIKIDESNEIVRKMRDANSGVGTFEQWFQKNHPAEYKTWKGTKAEEERKRQEAQKAAQETAEKQRQTQEAEQKRQTDERQRQEQASLEAAEEADAPFLDKLNTTVAGMEEGKWKTIATKLVAAFTGLFVMLSKAPLIGGWVRRNFISNKMLERLGDPQAKIAHKVEDQFRTLGLSRDLANELGGKKTKDVVVLIRDSQKLVALTTDTAVQGKLTALATQLADKGGAGSEVTLFEFMGNNPNWPGVQTAAAAAAPAAIVAAGSQGSAAPEAAPAPAAAPESAPETPDLQKQFITRINEQLKPYQGKTTDLTKGRVELQLPFIANGEIEQTRCVIYGNTFEIGAHKYRMDLPHNANLKSITIEGTAPSGTATLIAGKWGLSDGRELSLRDMLGHLEAIRQGPQTHQASIGADTATFTKIA